jgi:hypothetical protein
MKGNFVSEVKVEKGKNEARAAFDFVNEELGRL